MSKVLAIYKKELKGFLFSPTFYVVCALIAIVFSFIYPNVLSKFSEALQMGMMNPEIAGQQMNIHYQVFLPQLNVLNLMLIMIVPALTMRLFAEEKKVRTFDLLLTSPITSAEIVAGKYLAALSAVFGLCLIALLYPLATAAFTKLQWGSLWIAFFSIFAAGAVYAAVDLFCSSLTESGIIAYVLAVVLNMGLWFVGIAVDSVDNEILRSVFEHISINQHLVALVEGSVRTSSLIFIASLIFLFCFLCERVVEASRWRS